MTTPRHASFLVLLATLILLLAACHKKKHGDDDDSGNAHEEDDSDLSPQPLAPPPPSLMYGATVQVVDEAGAALAGASVRLGMSTLTTDAGGFVSFSGLSGPAALVVSQPGFLDEPVVIGREDAAATVIVPLWAEFGGGGERRVSIHMAGDVMLGRRYIDPGDDDTIVVTPGNPDSARAVVEHVAPIFGAASVSTANIETVVGTLPDSAGYPGKLFLIQSIPDITEMLDELGLDLAVLGNNHIRDWLEPGIASTTSILSTAGIPWVGAGIDATSAAVPALLPATGGLTVAVLSYSNVDGDSANDFYPLDTDPEPMPIPPGDAFRYESRTWGFAGPTVTIPVASRRIGSAWLEFDAAATGIAGTAEETALWSSAATVYPELQDWVARRGHGGANWFRASVVASDIAATRLAGADIVVVQIHSGPLNYADFKSEGQEGAFRAAIDGGADIAVGHHPHVLHGIELYNGRPIVYSLGNLVFDQNFLPTFSAGILRVVYEETTLLETRILPVTIHRYVPIPLAGYAARDVTRILHERSEIDAASRRYVETVAATLSPDVPGEGNTRVSHDRNSALISAGLPPTLTQSVAIGEDAVTLLDGIALTRSRGPGGSALTGVRFGRDLFRWGHFEDDAADAISKGGFNWRFPSEESAWKRVEFVETEGSFRAAYLHRKETNTTRTRVRPVARVNPVSHRLFNDVGGLPVPADGPASWSVAMRARYSGDGPITLILDVSHFNSSIPNEEPEAIFFRSVELEIEVENDDEWHEVLLDIPDDTWDPVGGKEANQALLYVALYPPDDGKSELYFDDVRFLEWRDAPSLPDFFFLVDAVRSSSGDATVTLERRGD